MKIYLPLVVSVLALSLGACNKKSASSALEASSLFSDDFNISDGPLSSDWVVNGSTISVVSQKAKVASTGTVSAFTANPVTAAGTSFAVTATLSISGGTISTAAHYVVANEPSTTVAGSEYLCGIGPANTVLIGRNLSIATSGTTTFNLTSGFSATILFTRQGSDLTCTVTDGNGNSETVTYTDSAPLTGNYFGILGNTLGSNYSSFDDFYIATIE